MITKTSTPITTDCESYLMGFCSGYAEVMADIETGEVFDEAVYLNCLDEVRYEYYHGYRAGVKNAITENLKQ